MSAWIAPAIAEGYLHGLIVGEVDANGAVAYGFGTTGSSGEAPSGKTMFQIDSVTKTFTGLWLAQLTQQPGSGVSLGDALQIYLPSGAVTVPQYRGAVIALRDLATHTSGLPDAPANLNPPDPLNPWAAYAVSDLYAFLNEFTPTYAPATHFVYSNIGEGLLGLALSLRGSQSYEEGLREAVLTPLKLEDTVATLSAEQSSRVAPAYNGDLEPTEAWTFTPASAGAGELWSTVDDLLAYAAAQAGLTSTPLDAAIGLSQQVQFADPSFGVGIGLNWIIESPDFIFHNGGSVGYSSFVGFDPITKKAIVVLGDTGTSGTPTALWSDLTTTIGLALLSWAQGKPPASIDSLLPPVASLSSQQLSELVGSYSLSGLGTPLVVTLETDHLEAQASWLWSQPVRIYPTSSRTFVSRVLPSSLSFDTTGSATSVSLELYGQTYTGSGGR